MHFFNELHSSILADEEERGRRWSLIIIASYNGQFFKRAKMQLSSLFTTVIHIVFLKTAVARVIANCPPMDNISYNYLYLNTIATSFTSSWSIYNLTTKHSSLILRPNICKAPVPWTTKEIQCDNFKVLENRNHRESIVELGLHERWDKVLLWWRLSPPRFPLSSWLPAAAATENLM